VGCVPLAQACASMAANSSRLAAPKPLVRVPARPASPQSRPGSRSISIHHHHPLATPPAGQPTRVALRRLHPRSRRWAQQMISSSSGPGETEAKPCLAITGPKSSGQLWPPRCPGARKDRPSPPNVQNLAIRFLGQEAQQGRRADQYFVPWCQPPRGWPVLVVSGREDEDQHR